MQTLETTQHPIARARELLCKRLALMFLTLIAAILAPSAARAGTRYASVSGNWNNTATWGGDPVPTSLDSVRIRDGVTNTVPTGYSAYCQSIDFDTGAKGLGAATIVLKDSNARLYVSTTVNIQGSYDSGGFTINVGAGIFEAGSVNLMGLDSSTGPSQILISTGQCYVNQDITSAGLQSQIIFSDRGMLIVGGNFMGGHQGTFTAAAGSTVMFQGSADQYIPFEYTFDSLTIMKKSGSGSVILQANVAINGDLTVYHGTLDLGRFTANRSISGGTFYLIYGANLLIGDTDGGTTHFPANYMSYSLDADSTVNYNGADQTVSVQRYGNLVFSGFGSKLMAAATLVWGNLAIDSPSPGAVSVMLGNSFPVSVGTLTLGGLGRVNDTWGSTLSPATYTNNTFFNQYFPGILIVSQDTRSMPSVNQWPTVSTGITYGQAVTNATLTGGSASVAGTFSYTTPTTFPPAGTPSESVTFTPADTTSYLTPLPNSVTVTVAKKALSVQGITAPSTVYDGTTTAKLGGAASLLDAEAKGTGTTSDGRPFTGDSVSLDGTSAGLLDSKDVGLRGVTVSGNSIGGPDSGNYTLNQQTGLSQEITPKALSATNNLVFAASKVYDGTNTATPTSGSAALQTAESAGQGTTSDGKPYSCLLYTSPSPRD